VKTVINIMEESPAYSFYADQPRPQIGWDTPDGRWVGIWGYDWPDQLGDEVLKRATDLEYEVWQPDLRADRVYTHQFPNGLRHSLFPAVIKRDVVSLGRRRHLKSESLLAELRRRLQDDVLVQLNNFRSAQTLEILELVKSDPAPLLITGHGSSLLPWEEMKSARHPATKVSLLLEHMRFMKAIRRANFVTDENQSQVKKLEKLLRREVGYLPMGSDFDFWIPRPADWTRPPAFDKLKKEGKTIFLSVGNFISRKRFDKLIEVFSSLANVSQFCLVLVGHGEPNYSSFLKRIGSALVERGQLIFVDYVRGEKLREIYWSSDVYVAAAASEGTSVAAEYAAGCAMPIISALNNGIADLLTQLQCGLVLPEYSLQSWAERFEQVLHGDSLRALPLPVVKEYYDWKQVASRFIYVYRRLFDTASRRKIAFESQAREQVKAHA